MMEARPRKRDYPTTTDDPESEVASSSKCANVLDCSTALNEESHSGPKADAQELAERILFSLLQVENCTRFG